MYIKCKQRNEGCQNIPKDPEFRLFGTRWGMCAGLIIHTRIKRVVFGTTEPKTGACGSMFSIIPDDEYNHRLEVTQGVLQNECSNTIKAFFAERRLARKKK